MFRIFILVLLAAFLCGCGKVDDQSAKVRNGDAPSVQGSSNTTTDISGPFDTTFNLSAGVTLVPGLDPAKPTDRVIIHLPDGSTYEGEARAGRPNGQGTLTNVRGSNEYGEWKDGIEYKVSGTIIFPDGSKEVGTWNNDGSASGGTIVWPDGRQYKGDWKFVMGQPDIPAGEGEMTWPDGRKYIGWFTNGTMDGPGKMTYPDGKVEDGTWKDGKFSGATP